MRHLRRHPTTLEDTGKGQANGNNICRENDSNYQKVLGPGGLTWKNQQEKT